MTFHDNELFLERGKETDRNVNQSIKSTMGRDGDL